MKHFTLKNIVATAALGVAASFAANAAPANTSVGSQFRVGPAATATQAIQHRGHQTDIVKSSAEQQYPRFRVPYPGQSSHQHIKAHTSDHMQTATDNSFANVGSRTWLR